MRAGIWSGMAIALVVATGCGERTRQADAKICTPFPAQAAPAADPTGASVGAAAAVAGGEAAAFDDCLHRWGYRLARAEGDQAESVARAVVAICSPALVRWNERTLSQQPAGGDTAISLVTGRTGTTPEDRFEMAQGKALFYVVQGRAGNCAAPAS